MNKFEAVVTRLNEIVEMEGKEPLDQLGSYIVGALIVDDEADKLSETDEALERIASLGSDLEISNGGDEWMQKDWQEVKLLVGKLSKIG